MASPVAKYKLTVFVCTGNYWTPFYISLAHLETKLKAHLSYENCHLMFVCVWTGHPGPQTDRAVTVCIVSHLDSP